jgi:hypothetical protein
MCNCREEIEAQLRLKYAVDGMPAQVYFENIYSTEVGIRKWIKRPNTFWKSDREGRYGEKCSLHETIIFRFCPICGEPYYNDKSKE